MNKSLRVICVLTSLFAATAAYAEGWPSRLIKATIPFGAGSAADVVPRLVFERLAAELGQPIVIENRAGAGGALGSALVAKAEPDGYSILAQSSALAIAPAIFPSTTFDATRDLASVLMIGSSANVMIVPNARPWKTIQDFIVDAKAKPGSISFGSVGIGSAVHISTEKFRFAAGIEATHVPYRAGPELIEKEPNDATNEATHLDVPCAVTGSIEKPGDEDRFTFAAKKGEVLLLGVQSASLGFPLDARLKVEDAKGKELTKKDDTVNADPMLEWTAPEDGTYFAAVGNVLHRGGPDHLYRLSISQAVPGLKAVVANNSFAIEPGKTNEIKVTVTRLHGFKSKLTVSARGLPEGLTVEPAEVPDKGGEVVLKLIASADAKPFSGAIQFAVTETESGTEHHAISELISSTTDNGVPQGFKKLVIESTDQLWLTVLSAPAQTPEAEKKH